MTDYVLDKLGDPISAEQLAELAEHGNMTARAALAVKLRHAEETASLASMRLMLGEVKFKAFVDLIFKFRERLYKIPQTPRGPLEQAADVSELIKVSEENAP